MPQFPGERSILLCQSLKKDEMVPTIMQELNQYSRNVGGARLRNLPIITRIAFPNIDRFVSNKQIESFPKMINSEFAQKTGVFEKLKHYGIDQSGWIAATDLNEQRRWTYENIFPTNAVTHFIQNYH